MSVPRRKDIHSICREDIAVAYQIMCRHIVRQKYTECTEKPYKLKSEIYQKSIYIERTSNYYYF